MHYIADLHIHSPFSRATSKSSDLFGLAGWARIKGIHLIGTGDFTHPGWFAHLQENLCEAEPGLFRLKDERPLSYEGMQPEPIEVRFLLSAEISSIYKRHGKVRKIHNLLYVPSFADAARINARLTEVGNIEADGRPILGLDSRDLLEILLENSAHGFMVPAHIWTPWFSLFGSKSGFNSLEECYGDLSSHIFALETGLSSDPAMNRLLSALDQCSLISNSDCHSPSKLGREANLFNTDFDFFSLRRSLEQQDPVSFPGTVEFFPEEGKYHFDGHRKCGICFNPEESESHRFICPVCERPLTIGVHHRVLELADRTQPVYPSGEKAFRSLIPLPEVLGEINGRGPSSKLVMQQYRQLIDRFGSEFNILLAAPEEELASQSSLLAEAISRMRQEKVIRRPGYDGEFGTISVFSEDEIDSLRGQISLFATQMGRGKHTENRPEKSERADLQKRSPGTGAIRPAVSVNAEQLQAIESGDSHLLVVAGPGTGKTFTLVHRLLHLLKTEKARAERTALITFTNKAAEEMTARLRNEEVEETEKVFVGTFHAFCLHWLRRFQSDLKVLGPEERIVLLRHLFPEAGATELQKLIEKCTIALQNPPGSKPSPSFPAPVLLYLNELKKRALIDLDGIIAAMLEGLVNDPVFSGNVYGGVEALLIDEFQDVNPLQFDLVVKMAHHAGIFAIGDPDQAIYGFRGSDPGLFQRFGQLSFAGRQVRTVSLHRNYRNGSGILSAAQQLIVHNSLHLENRLAAQQDLPCLLETHRSASPAAEAQYIIQRIEEMVGGISHFSINSGRGGNSEGEIGFSDIAVLCRLKEQAGPLREAFEIRGIPCQIVGLQPFYMQGALRLAAFWIMAAAGLTGDGEFLQLFEALPGVGRESIRKLEDLVFKGGDVLDPAGFAILPSAARQSVTIFLERLDRAIKEGTGSRRVRDLAAAGMHHLDIEDHTQTERFLQLAGSFGTDLTSFARHLRRNSQTSVYDERTEAVCLMTIHAAKGLEFDTVFIAGLEEEILPHKCGNDDSDLEEERRLFYVALTRARRQVILTCCRERQVHGKRVTSTPSRFLEELPQKLLVVKNASFSPVKKPAATQLSLFPS